MSEKFDQLKIMQEMFPNATFVDANGERIAGASKTIDHIADVSKKVSLTEQWKKDELMLYQPYYIKLKNGAIRTAEYRHMVYDGERCVGFGLYHNEVEEVLAEVPDYIEWRNYVTGFCDEHEYNLKLLEENQQLKELLKEWIHYYPIILYEHEDTLKTKDIIELYDRTREALK